MKKDTLTFENTKEAIDYIMAEMFKRVNAEYDSEFIMQDFWFTKYEWTLEEQESFRIWFYEQLRNNTSLRNFILQSKYCDSKTINKVSYEFIFNYGWKIKEDE
jgi:hypothetical protein